MLVSSPRHGDAVNTVGLRAVAEADRSGMLAETHDSDPRGKASLDIGLAQLECCTPIHYPLMSDDGAVASHGTDLIYDHLLAIPRLQDHDMSNISRQ